MKKTLLMLLSLNFLSLWADEKQITIDLTLNNSFTGNVANQTSENMSSGLAYLNFKIKNDVIQSELALKSQFSTQDSFFDLYKAYVKFRDNNIQGYVGINTLSTGQGSFYNAGDVVFQENLQEQFTQKSFTPPTKMYYGFRYALDRFSFIELNHILPDWSLKNTALGLPQSLETKHGSFLGRINFKLGPIISELGYLTRGKDFYINESNVKIEGASHNPYLAITFPFFADFYASSALKIQHMNYDEERLKKSWIISNGLFYKLDLTNYDNGFTGDLNFRFENKWIPYGEWEEQQDSKKLLINPYAVEIYREIILNLFNDYMLLSRALYSPIDQSILLSLGYNQVLYGSINLTAIGSIQLGEEHDTFPLYDHKGLSFNLMINYVY